MNTFTSQTIIDEFKLFLNFAYSSDTFKPRLDFTDLIIKFKSEEGIYLENKQITAEMYRSSGCCDNSLIQEKLRRRFHIRHLLYDYICGSKQFCEVKGGVLAYE